MVCLCIGLLYGSYAENCSEGGLAGQYRNTDCYFAPSHALKISTDKEVIISSGIPWRLMASEWCWVSRRCFWETCECDQSRLLGQTLSPWENEGGPVLLCACRLGHHGFFNRVRREAGVGELTQIGREKVFSFNFRLWPLSSAWRSWKRTWDMARTDKGFLQEEEYVGGRNSTVFWFHGPAIYDTQSWVQD